LGSAAVVIALSLGTLQPVIGAPADMLTGHWEAIARKDGRSWRFNIDIPGGKPQGVTADLLDIAAYGVEFRATRRKNTIHLERKTAAAITVIDGKVDGARITGRLLWSGIEAPFTGNRRDTPPPALAEEDVVFTNGTATLAGTVIHPTGEGPYPAIVCTHGSGPGDRQFAAYRSEGVFYARLGLAALIYDRRGSGKSTGDSAGASIEDLADDALAGVEILKSMKNVQSHEIGISGISQGGWIAPLAASRSKDVAFVIVLSASGINPMEQSIFDVENALRRGGYGETVVAEASGLRRRIYDFARSGVPDPGLSAALEAVHGEPWFRLSALPDPQNVATVSPGERQFLQFEPVPAWEKVAVPVLALWGGGDASVPASSSRAIIESALAAGGNRDHTLVLYPTADHGLRIVREKSDAWDFPRTVPGARLFLAEWLREHVRASSPASVSGPEWMPS
jgi:pimeloyl-ACP methyl ester carboxylesterase